MNIELLDQLFQDLALGMLLDINSTYSKIDKYLFKLERTLSFESNSIEQKYWALVEMTQFTFTDVKLQQKALNILEKSFQDDNSPIILDFLCINISRITNSRASNILIKAIKVCLNLFSNLLNSPNFPRIIFTMSFFRWIRSLNCKGN